MSVKAIMFGLVSRTVTIQLDAAEVRFSSLRDFEFAVAGRIGLPASKISALVELSDEELLREAESIRKLEQRFSEILSAAMETDTPVGPVLEALDLSFVSQDHDWRLIIGALNLTSGKFEDYKRTALIKYMQYLTARQEVIRTLYSHRQRNRAEGSTQVGSDDNTAMRETMIFDLSDVFPDQAVDSNLARLPKGATIEIDLQQSEELPLVLVKHACRIVNDGALHFIDHTGARTELKQGQNTIGRDDICDIILRPNHRDISRKHLVVELLSDTAMRLTDISSLGTFAPPERLERTIL